MQDRTPADETAAHLAANRPRIVLRSLLYAACGAVPVPIVDDALRAGLRRGLLRQVAQSQKVDIDEAALDVLCADAPGEENAEVSTGIAAAVGSALSFLRGRRWARRLILGVVILRQLGEAQRVFQHATLFDHYCARHHLGPGIDARLARQLRGAFDQAGKSTQRELLEGAVNRSLALCGHAAEVVPQRIVQLIRRTPAPQQADDQPHTAEHVEPRRLLEVVQGGTRRLLRDAGLHRYSRRLVAAFDRTWSQRDKES